MNRYRIIIVENDEDEQEFMKEGFDKVGTFSIEAILGNGDQLFEWLENNPERWPDLVLSDLNMPGKNGYDILQQVRDTPAYQNLPVIITSTSSTLTTIDKCLSLGAAGFLVKPETFIDYESFARELYRKIENEANRQA